MKYLHLGKGTLVREDEILGIFDLDITSQSHLTRKFLSMADKAAVLVCPWEAKLLAERPLISISRSSLWAPVRHCALSSSACRCRS